MRRLRSVSVALALKLESPSPRRKDTKTFYIRRVVDITAKISSSTFVMRSASDDFANIFLNGVAVTSEAYGSGSVMANGHPAVYWNNENEVLPSALVAGQNVVAVELVNGQPSATMVSSDLYFDAEFDVFVGVKSTGAATPKPTVADCTGCCQLRGEGWCESIDVKRVALSDGSQSVRLWRPRLPRQQRSDVRHGQGARRHVLLHGRERRCARIIARRAARRSPAATVAMSEAEEAKRISLRLKALFHSTSRADDGAITARQRRRPSSQAQLLPAARGRSQALRDGSSAHGTKRRASASVGTLSVERVDSAA